MRATTVDTRPLPVDGQFLRFRRWAVLESGLHYASVHAGSRTGRMPHHTVAWAFSATNSVLAMADVTDPAIWQLRSAGGDVPPVVRVMVTGEGIRWAANGRPTATLTPGRIYVTDNQDAQAVHVTRRTWHAMIQVPRADLRISDAQLEHALDGGINWQPWQGALLVEHCRIFGRTTRAERYQYDPIGLESHIYAFVELLIRSAGYASDPPRTAAERYRQAVQFIETHLTDPDLSPGSIAAHQGISARQLARCFPAGETLTDTVRRLRIERAHTRLGDIRYANVTIAEIARQCGFISAPHFSRAYKEHYGRNPRSTRTAAPT